MPAIKDILIQGGKQQKVLEMTYKKKDGSVVKRKVEPYEIRGDVFWGWDTNDDHIKRFVIWRIRDAKVTKDSFDPRFDIKMSKAGGVTAKSMTSSLEITLNGLRGILSESSGDLDEVHSIRRELIAQMREMVEAEENKWTEVPDGNGRVFWLTSVDGKKYRVAFREGGEKRVDHVVPNGWVVVDDKENVLTRKDSPAEAKQWVTDVLVSGKKPKDADGAIVDVDLTKLPSDIYELPDTAGITKVGEALTKQIHGSVYRMRRIEHKRFGTVYAVWYRTYLPVYYSPKDGFIHSGGDTPLTGEVKKKTEWLVGLYNKIYKDGVRAGSE